MIITQQKSLRKTIFLIIASSAFFGSFVTWVIMNQINAVSITSIIPIRENDKSTPFIRPLLAYNTPESQTASSLKNDLKATITTAINTKKANTVALYYRDLNTGRWFGINQDETFVPASLFKVPLLITYLKDVEKHQNLLSMTIRDTLTHDENSNETIKPIKSVVEGQTYTIEELLRYMIEYSDNNATVLLFKNINQQTLQEVFSDLDVQLPVQGINTDFISVANYSLFFRVLYNATYLNHDLSEKGLEMLSKIDFNEGIRKSIPSTVAVADKFGEYYLVQDGATHEHQLHDCGIVYHPKRPYILCIMTKGSSLDELKKIIQDLSKRTYMYVDSLQ